MPRPPRRASARAHDPIVRYQGGQKALLIIGGAFCLIGLPAGILAAWGVPTDVMIELAGGETTGAVTRAHIDRSTAINEDHFEAGDRVVLLYLPDNPKVNTIYLD